MIIIVDNNKLMDNERYLYGAAVQGIQNFIFQTVCRSKNPVTQRKRLTCFRTPGAGACVTEAS